MKRFRHCLCCIVAAVLVLLATGGRLRAQAEGAPPSPPAESQPAAATAPDTTTQAAAAVAAGYAEAPRQGFLEHLVDVLLQALDVRTTGNTWQRYAIAAVLLVGAFLLRRVVATMIFAVFRKVAARTRTTLDDKVFPALEEPVKALIAVAGIVAAMKVLKLAPESENVVRYASTVAFSLVVFWLALRAFNTLLDHIHEIARARQLGVAAFMPWIKKSLAVIVVTFGVLLIAQNLGADVKAFLAGLGIGGLAFALAAQDTIANVFGSVVVAVDQPFKLGEFVRIGSFLGLVEDIGLRSTRLRAVDKSLITIPNKTVAAEAITNLSRFTQRRVEQVIGLTYDTPAEQMDAVVEEFRSIILAEDEVDPTSVMVFFRDYSASSLDIWIVYVVKDPDFQKHMRLRQRVNLKFMRAVQARGLSFAFPTQTLHLEGEAIRKIAERQVNGAGPAQAGRSSRGDEAGDR